MAGVSRPSLTLPDRPQSDPLLDRAAGNIIACARFFIHSESTCPSETHFDSRYTGVSLLRSTLRIASCIALYCFTKSTCGLSQYSQSGSDVAITRLEILLLWT